LTSEITWDPTLGQVHPRLATPLAADVPSYGPAVAEWAEKHLGVKLLEWQVVALTRQLAHDGTGRLLHDEALTTVARQNGKTVALWALIGWWLTEGPKVRGRPQHVLSLAHKLDAAEEVFEGLLAVLEHMLGPENVRSWNTHGRKVMRLPDGSSWKVHAATRSAGHSTTNDLIVVDEVWDVDEDVIEKGLRPTMRTRAPALLSCWSTAGDEGSVFMKRQREMGIAAVESGVTGDFCLSEWSPPPGVDPLDERYWCFANPSLGHLFDLDGLRKDSRKPDKLAFMRGGLNLWVSASRAWIQAGQWDSLKGEFGPLSGGVLVVDASTDGTSWVGVRCAMVESVACVEVEFVTDREPDVWDAVEALMVDKQLRLYVGAALEVHMPPALEKRAGTVGQAELGQWTKIVRSMIVTEQRVAHRGDARLDEHVRRAVGVSSAGNNMTLSSLKSPGPIEMARCMVFAVALASQPMAKRRLPGVAGTKKSA
jgi:hypothetical protein